MNLSEQYRPKTLADLIGQPKAVKVVQRIADRGLGGRAFWVSGVSGIGKSSLAYIIAGMIAEPLFIQEYVARKVTPRVLDEIERQSRYFGLGKGGRVFIINEAHGLSAPVIEQLLDFTDPHNLPSHVVVIFTTTKLGEKSLEDQQIDAHPLLSRCVQIALTNQGVAPLFAKRAREIAKAEGLDGKPDAAYTRLVNGCFSNMREVLQSIENGDMLT